jgi:hypothetical protein
MKPIMTDDLLDQVSRIYERTRDEVLTLIRSHEPAQHLATPPREWMSATQLAEYWQLYNDNDEPTTAGILKWAKRPADKFHYLTPTWEIFCDSIAMKLINGPGKKLKGGEHKLKSVG